MSRHISIVCVHCGKTAKKPAGAVNRARRKKAPLYCGRQCAGLGRRKNLSDAEKREAKRLYDIQYRAKNHALLKKKKAEYFQRTYDPEKARIQRKARMAQHVEYCRRPEYKEWKQAYDRKYRAKKHYGQLWESYLLMLDIRNECLSRQTDYEIRLSKGGVAKSQERKRHDARTHREELKSGTLGNPTVA